MTDEVVVEIDYLQQWVGRTETAEDIVSSSLVDRFVATAGGFASLPVGAHARYGERAPRLIHFCLALNPAPQQELDVDGHPHRGGFLPPVPLPRRMWAASDISFHADLLIGSTVERRSRIAAVEEKTGKTGRLVFVTVEHSFYSNQRLCIKDRQTIVYREPDTGAPASSSAARKPVAGVHGSARIVHPASPLLFRYSALTFNAHRIHYDHDYAVQEEGYPGLVVHGPLQATLLYYQCSDAHGSRWPDHFRFRGVAPLCAPDPFELRAGTIENGEMQAITMRADGVTAMKAVAQWR